MGSKVIVGTNYYSRLAIWGKGTEAKYKETVCSQALTPDSSTQAANAWYTGPSRPEPFDVRPAGKLGEVSRFSLPFHLGNRGASSGKAILEALNLLYIYICMYIVHIQEIKRILA